MNRSAEQRRKFLQGLSDAEAFFLAHDWQFWARPEQLIPPGDWYVWFVLAGRGWGKTRTGAETVRRWVKNYRFVNILGPTADDARDVMVEGESGILSICMLAERPVYKKSDRLLLWPNGCKTLIFTADEPERLRGKQHEKLWADEIGAWRYPEEAWDNAMLGLRLGDNPQAVVTSTPRPTKQIKELLVDPGTIVTRGTTYDNKANLSAKFFKKIISKYEGTRLGRQELKAELLEDTPGALWNIALLDQTRLESAPALIRIVVAVDPEASSNAEAAETGIIVGGLADNGHAYILSDATTQGTPAEWGGAAVRAYHFHSADAMVGEVNNGGEMVGYTIYTLDATVNFKAVRATRGKYLRAEPISALYERGLIHHVGVFGALESQMTTWVPGQKSPDRLDALVWLLTEIYFEGNDHQEESVGSEERVNISEY